MSIRRVEKTGISSAPAGKIRRTGSASEATFSQHLEALAALRNVHALDGIQQIDALDPDEAPFHQRREQLERTGELLDSLEALEKELVSGGRGGASHQRLRTSRDEALRTLSNSPPQGAERDLLHRTAVLATVELAKTDRGDYH
jgi:hypothetical protein